MVGCEVLPVLCSAIHDTVHDAELSRPEAVAREGKGRARSVAALWRDSV